MQNFFILVVFLFLVTLIQYSNGQKCDCTFCMDKVNVSANTQNLFSNTAACPTGTAAAVSALNVESTDGSGFQVFTKDDPSSTTSYTAGSTSSIVTCFKMGSGFFVGGQKPRIYVVIQCSNGFRPCSLRYSISITCATVQASSTIKSTAVSTIKPIKSTTVSTIKPIKSSTNPAALNYNVCECHCCRESSVCAPKHVGTLLYGLNTCTESDCTSRCSRQFSSCLISVDSPAKIKAHCKTNAGTTFKNLFYIPLLILILYILN
ncbi:hypothetical protein I4U23_004497 [Adineta vaga]|nr:hypothetical protein I4U23_004497 [Adineta vaga]